MSSGGGGNAVVGYWYYLDVLLTYCHGPVDEVVEIVGGERSAWSGLVTTNALIDINNSGLFGGEEREGGWVGGVEVMLGADDQVIPTSLENSLSLAEISTPSPAYRGVTSLFFTQGTYGQTGFAWSAMNPYFKSPKARLRRYPKWYSAKARIGNDANPVHIVYECLTNVSWGLGMPINDLDDARFRAAADTLYTEGFGVSLSWNQSSTIEDFVGSMLRHFNGVLNQDRTTGQIFVGLIRDDYDINTLPVLDPSNCQLESMSRAGAAEIVNEITLKYTRKSDGEVDSLTIQDLASIQNQGRIIAQEVDLPGIREPDLAARVAQRELQSRSRGLAKITLTATRAAYGLYEGDVFKLNWPELGITGLVCRVATLDIGDLESATIRIEATEDVFGLPSFSYVVSPPIGWTDNSSEAKPVVKQRAIEAPYYTVVKTTSATERADYPVDFGFGLLLAKTPQLSAVNYQLKSSQDNSSYVTAGIGNWTPHCELSSSVAWNTTALPITGPSLMELATAGSLVYCESEVMEVVSYAGTTLTVRRGVLDSVPASHAAGAEIFVVPDGLMGYDTEIRVSGEQVWYKALTRSPQETLPISSAPAASLTLSNRFARPYPPGNVTINGQYFPATLAATGSLTVAWAHRDRTMQTVSPLPVWTAGNIGPEAGTTYNVRVYDGANNVISSYTGISTTSQSVTTGVSAALAEWTLDSISGGTIADEGGVYPATNNGGTVVAGHSGDALAFAALGSRITVPHNAAFNFGGTGDFSFSLWARWTNTAIGLILGKFSNGYPYDGPVVLVNNGMTGPIQFRTSSDGSQVLTSTATDMHDNQWRHFAFVREGLTLRIYINGVLDSSRTTSIINDFVHTTDLYFMGRADNAHQMTGEIDDIQVYAYALTAGQVGTIYAEGGLSVSRRIEVESVRDGITSKVFSHTVTLV